MSAVTATVDNRRRARAAPPPEGPREALARQLALAGLGRTDGGDRMTPPNETWTQEEWERRVLGCVPGAVHERCLALADQILASLSQGDGR